MTCRAVIKILIARVGVGARKRKTLVHPSYMGLPNGVRAEGLASRILTHVSSLYVLLADNNIFHGDHIDVAEEGLVAVIAKTKDAPHIALGGEHTGA